MRNYNNRYVSYKGSRRNDSWSQNTNNRVSNKPKTSLRTRGGWSPVNRDNWRDSNDYREEYFRRNKGIAGRLYICSQCFKPMLNKSKIQVDHILPPSVFARRKRSRQGYVKTSMLAEGLNKSFNCAAICGPCNLKKSNKISFGYLFRGLLVKGIEVVANAAQMLAVAALYVALWVAPIPFKIAGRLFSSFRGNRSYRGGRYYGSGSSRRRSYGRYAYS